jgi:hypothetical protein
VWIRAPAGVLATVDAALDCQHAMGLAPRAAGAAGGRLHRRSSGLRVQGFKRPGCAGTGALPLPRLICACSAAERADGAALRRCWRFRPRVLWRGCWGNLRAPALLLLLLLLLLLSTVQWQICKDAQAELAVLAAQGPTARRRSSPGLLLCT